MSKMKGISEFKYGKAILSHGDKRIAISENRKKLFVFKVPHFKKVEVENILEDGFIVSAGGYYGFVNNKGKILLDCVFDHLVYSEESKMLEGRFDNEVHLFTFVNGELNFEKGYEIATASSGKVAENDNDDAYREYCRPCKVVEDDHTEHSC